MNGFRNNKNNNNKGNDCNEVDSLIVKVVFPVLDCSKLMKLESKKVCYSSLIKFLIKSKVNEETIKSFILFTERGVPIYSGASLLQHHVKEKDTLVFKNKEYRKDGESWIFLCSMLNNFLKRRPVAEDLVTKSILVPYLPNRAQEYEPLPLDIAIIEKCLQYLYIRKAYTVEGLFRVSGSKNEVRLVYDSFKSDADIEWVLDLHTIATALKHYIRFSSPPIIVYKIATSIVYTIIEGGEGVVGCNTTEIFNQLKQLPSYHRQALVLLIGFFKKMLENQQENKMGLHNIAIVWGPNLLPIDLPDVDIFTHPFIQSTFAATLITYADEMW